MTINQLICTYCGLELLPEDRKVRISRGKQITLRFHTACYHTKQNEYAARKREAELAPTPELEPTPQKLTDAELIAKWELTNSPTVIKSKPSTYTASTGKLIPVNSHSLQIRANHGQGYKIVEYNSLPIDMTVVNYG